LTIYRTSNASGILEKVIGIEHVIAQEKVCVAMKFVPA